MARMSGVNNVDMMVEIELVTTIRYGFLLEIFIFFSVLCAL